MFKRYFSQKINNLSPQNFARLMGIWPPYLGAGISVQYLSPDYRHADVQLKMHWWNKNYVGTHFGGSMYAMTDPFYMLILIKNLGSDYIVWDKASSIDFIKIGKGTLRASFNFSEEELADVRKQADTLGKYIFDRSVDILNEDNEMVARVVKTLYVRRK
jgi:hypothetical protein